MKRVWITTTLLLLGMQAQAAKPKHLTFKVGSYGEPCYMPGDGEGGGCWDESPEISKLKIILKKCKVNSEGSQCSGEVLVPYLTIRPFKLVVTRHIPTEGKPSFLLKINYIHYVDPDAPQDPQETEVPLNDDGSVPAKFTFTAPFLSFKRSGMSEYSYAYKIDILPTH